MAHKHSGVWIFIVLLGVILFLAIGLLKNSDFYPFNGFKMYNRTGNGPIALVKVIGAIDGAMAQNIIEQINKFADDNEIQGMLLRIDSPGGGVAPSQEIYNALMRFKKKGKIIYVSMGSLAASGGYYIAAASNRIYANPGTLTGSIGVIINFPKYEELLKKIGVSFRTIKSAKFKDIGSPFRNMTEDEKKLLHDVILDVYNQFIDAIAVNRPDKIESIRKYADGRIFSGKQGLKYGFVDELGDQYTVLEELKKALNVTENITPVEIKRKEQFNFLKKILGGNSQIKKIFSSSYEYENIMEYMMTF